MKYAYGNLTRVVILLLTRKKKKGRRKEKRRYSSSFFFSFNRSRIRAREVYFVTCLRNSKSTFES